MVLRHLSLCAFDGLAVISRLAAYLEQHAYILGIPFSFSNGEQSSLEGLVAGSGCKVKFRDF